MSSSHEGSAVPAASNPDDAPAGAVCGPKGALTSEFWQARYDEGSTGWDRGGPSPMLTTWLTTGMLTPCRILVPGCGRGHEVVALAEAGFDVVAIDYAAAAVASVSQALEARQLQAKVVQTDLFDYQPDAPFDAVYEQTCLCALSPSRWNCYEKRLAAWIAPGGGLFAVFMQTDREQGPPFACPPDAMRDLFDEARWAWPERLEPVPHPMGLTELAGVLRRHPGDAMPR